MVHNGIEYGDMQLICEAYQIMRDLLQMSADEMHLVFKEWNKGDLDSYLIEITRDILAFRDTDGKPLVDKILDTAGQKGTGKWTAVAALDQGIPLTLIGEAVFARCLSAVKEERVKASKILHGPEPAFSTDKKEFIHDLKDALYASKIVSYAQGYSLMRAAASEYKWDLNYGGIALMWRGGCIIRSAFLGKIKEAFVKNPAITNLLIDPFFTEKLIRRRKDGGMWLLPQRQMASRCLQYHQLSVISTAIAAKNFRRICFRLREITSVLTPMSVPTNPEVNSSIPTGQDEGEQQLQLPIMYNLIKSPSPITRNLICQKKKNSADYRWTVCALIFFATTVNYLDRQVIGILKATFEVQILELE